MKKKEIKFTIAFDVIEKKLTDKVMELKFLKNKWHILKSNNYEDIWHVVLNNGEPETYQFKNYRKLRNFLIEDLKGKILKKYESVELTF